MDQINYKQEHLELLRMEQRRYWTEVARFVRRTDMLRIATYLSRKERREKEIKLSKQHDHLERFKVERYGHPHSQYSCIFNLTSLELTTLEKEVLSRGLKFGIPPKPRREEVIAEIEILFRQLKYHDPTSDETLDACRIRLANAAESFQKAINDLQGFSLKAEHLRTMKALCNNKDIVIVRPDKGQGVVLMERP